ncbi:hypothetical protein Vadar_005822 [Vaccinium darrowii]|uniref:Uncharacterized protein n=1 Tax=Vaccinium darrowii TaxID=229202 RepID=A0ACB7YTC1_9ERIC|nr:hypothetical protein Vadar_005822 [Vaccinium darrowii]
MASTAAQAPPSASPFGDPLSSDFHPLQPDFPLSMASSPPKSTTAAFAFVAAPPLASPSGDRLLPDSHPLPPDFPLPWFHLHPTPDPEMWIIQGTLAWRTPPVQTGV